MQTRITDRGRRGCAPSTAARPSWPCPTPTRSRPRWPPPSAPTSTCSSASSCRRARSPRSLYGAGGPDRARRELDRRRPDRGWCRREPSQLRLRPRRALHRRRRRAARAARLLPPGRRRRASWSSVKCEKQQVAALAEYLAGVLADLPARRAAGARRLDLIEPVVRGVDRGHVVGGLRRAGRPHRDRRRGGRPEDFEEPEDPTSPRPPTGAAERPEPGIAAGPAHPGPGGRLHRPRHRAGGGRPARRARCAATRRPEDHACPRTNGHGPPR